MLRKKMLWAAAVLMVAAADAQAQTVDELIAKNLAARGGKDRILAIQSARLTGKVASGPGVEAPFTMEWKRPNSVRLEFTIQGMTGVQAFDGTTGWIAKPQSDPEKLSDTDAADIAVGADYFDDPLIDYRTKGHSAELIGKESIEGGEAYKIKLTKRSGQTEYIYLDAETSLEVMSTVTRTSGGQDHELEMSKGDFKELSGVLFPYALGMKPKGTSDKQTMTIEKIELNTDEPADRFKMPEPKPAEPAKPPAN